LPEETGHHNELQTLWQGGNGIVQIAKFFPVQNQCFRAVQVTGGRLDQRQAGSCSKGSRRLVDRISD